MKSTIIAIAIALAGCPSRPVDSTPDAAIYIDAATKQSDAASPPGPTGGCPMGNLPGSRTATITDADPVPHALLNELQDTHISGAFNPESRRVFPAAFSTSSGTVVCVPRPGLITVAPSWKLTGGAIYAAAIPYTAGDIVTGIAVEVYGDAAVDWSGLLVYWPDHNSLSGSVTVANSGASNQAATWADVVLTAGTPAALTDTGILVLSFELTSPNTTFLHVGYVSPVFKRDP